MNKLEKGMYVRTNKGIFQIRNKNVFIEDKKQYIGVNGRYTCIDIETIEKASHNIIDLIEVGDYVNGCYIQEIKSLKDNVMVCMLDSDYEFVSTITNKEIRTIVTKEQFSSMEYRLGE